MQIFAKLIQEWMTVMYCQAISKHYVKKVDMVDMVDHINNTAMDSFIEPEYDSYWGWNY